ncbi:hypothetical protein [Sphingosinithalassobacter sp. CS137]|uniref:hypothetical protein n=1 Tax=Sphingosinithalassobacter sp. CS137 TaxID=2762748 RepID=UPI00165E68DF|nr:hypothetical protein [Sphingosinithalassobacter sp. CS137]
MMIRTTLAAMLLVGTVTPALAQNVGADPNYGERSLSSGFTPDPFTVRMTSGGSVSASNAAGGCSGYITDAPDLRLRFDAGSLPLIISTQSQDDVTLVVNAPDGRWYCDDDSGDGLNALVRFNSPRSGRYEIWVGSYDEDVRSSTTLQISELESDGRRQDARSGDRPDVGADPNYREISLESGFLPDPYTLSLRAGGSLSADVISGCRGYVTQAPDVRLRYTNDDMGDMPLIVSVDSSSDTTLMVNAPDGNWYCDDDGGEGSNPSVRFDSPLEGRYEIWVGTYSSGSTQQATLHISELESQ